ncbi:MAG: aromatic ring-hydroxylating dioxygenase subunit alpha [Myxococcota bacterium]|nr:aromatic ring-hydroxylating dioxygenase subunit alpha [Myxococcota bacterium]
MTKTLPSNVTALPSRPGPTRVSSARYINEDFLNQEINQVFKRAWLAACPAHKLRRKGGYMVLDEIGESVIVIRDGSGEIRAFHNSCRHRGSRLVDGRGRLGQIKCPYHDWRYELDGKLKSIPRADGFDCLDTKNLNLREVRTARWAGFIWVNFDDDAPPLLDTLSGVEEELKPYELEDMRAVQTFERIVPCNWKVMLENAMDFYHVSVVHSASVSRHVDTGPDLRSYGDHTRQRLEIATYAWRERLDAACSRGGPYTALQRSALHKYLLFPNFLINVLPYHVTVMQPFPIDAQTCRLRYAFCRRKGSRGIELARVLGTLAASRYILWEDIKIIQRFQEGVSTGRVTEQFFHDEEGAGAHFHGVLDRWMGVGGVE